MAQFGFVLRARRLVGTSLALVLLGSLIPLASMSAAATVTQIAGSPVSISADTNAATGTGAYTAISGPAVNGSGAGDIAAGTIVLTLPAGFEFDPTVTTAPVPSGSCGGLTPSAISYSASNTKATTTLTGAPSSGACSVPFLGLMVRPKTGTPTGSGNITNTGTSGPGGSTSYGTLTITTGLAHHLLFSQYPSSPTPALLTPQPIVKVVDRAGNTVTTDNGRNITLTTQNTGTFSCGASTARSTVNGVATFTNCTQATVANGYTLTATSTTGSAVIPVTGPSFDVTSGLASKLLLCWGAATVCNTTPPAPITGGTPFSTQPTVRVTDAAGNVVPTDNSTVVTLGILAGTPTSGGPGTLTCANNSVTVVNGIGTFSDCKIDKAGTGYRLKATSSPELTAAQSNAFNVVVGPAVKLAFIVQPPASASAGAPFPGNIQVAIVDAGGNTVSAGITATINLAIGTNPGAGTLTCSGGNNATTVNGVATFTGCAINNQGNGYTLTATATATAPVTALTPATSNPINVLAPLAAITLSAPPIITWGQHMTLAAHFGTNGANKVFTIQVSRDGVTFTDIAGAVLTTNASGDASFDYGPSDNRFYRVSFAGTPDLQAGTSNVVRTVVRQTNHLGPSHAGYQALGHGTQIEFKSTVRPNRPGLPQPVVDFVVYQLTGNGWTKVLDRMINTDRNPASADYGKAVLFITFNTPGKFYVRSQAIPTPLNANSGWSAPVRYIVQ